MPILLAAWGFIKPVIRLLGTGITIPIGLILAAGLWMYFDRASAVRHAVDRAVTELVAGEELAAARARENGLRTILEEQKRRAAMAEQARRDFEQQQAEAEAHAEELSNELADLKGRAVNPDCTVDDDISGRLHNR